MSFPLAVAAAAGIAAAVAAWVLTGRRPAAVTAGSTSRATTPTAPTGADGNPRLPDAWAYRKLTPDATFEAAVCPAHRTAAA